MSETRISASRFSARSAPTKSSTNSSAGVHQQLGRGRVLGDPAALAHDRDPVAHLDRLVDVVGDEEDGLADLGLEAQELVLQALAVDRVDRAEGLVHQHHQGVRGERPRHPDPLLLAAGELRRVAVGEVGVEADQLEQLGGARAARAPCPSRAAGARWRCSRRSCGGGRGRPAGSRSRSRAAAGPARGRAPTRSPIRMSPSVISTVRLTIRIAVVLPQPDGPTRTQISPAGTSRVRPSTAATSEWP